MNRGIEKDLVSSILIPIAALVLTAVVTQFLQSNLAFTIHLSVTIALFFMVIILFLRNREPSKSFLKRTYPNRNADSEQEEIKAIANAEQSVKVLGISDKILWSNQSVFRDALLECGHRRNVKLTFLLLNPEGGNLEPKAEDEGESPTVWRNDIDASIGRFKELKAKHTDLDFELILYDVFPIWHMVIIDDRIGYIGYYPTKQSASYAPLYVLEKGAGNLSLLIPLIKHFNNLRDNGKKLI
jgi:hypothetical protein